MVMTGIIRSKTPASGVSYAPSSLDCRLMSRSPCLVNKNAKDDHMGVWTKSLARRTLPQWLSAGVGGCVSRGSPLYIGSLRDPSMMASILNRRQRGGPMQS